MRILIRFLIWMLPISLLMTLSGCKTVSETELRVNEGVLDFQSAGISEDLIESVKVFNAGQTLEISEKETILEILTRLKTITFTEMQPETNSSGWSTEAPGSRHLTITLIAEDRSWAISLPLYESDGKTYLAPSSCIYLFQDYWKEVERR